MNIPLQRLKALGRKQSTRADEESMHRHSFAVVVERGGNIPSAQKPGWEVQGNLRSPVMYHFRMRGHQGNKGICIQHLKLTLFLHFHLEALSGREIIYSVSGLFWKAFSLCMLSHTHKHKLYRIIPPADQEKEKHHYSHWRVQWERKKTWWDENVRFSNYKDSTGI